MVESVEITEIKRPSGWSPVRRELDVRSFGINAWSGDDGASLVGEHAETSSGHEELYLVLSGTARFTVDGDELDAGPGRIVFARNPATKRAAVAPPDGPTRRRVRALGRPGGAERRPEAGRGVRAARLGGERGGLRALRRRQGGGGQGDGDRRANALRPPRGAHHQPRRSRR